MNGASPGLDARTVPGQTNLNRDEDCSITITLMLIVGELVLVAMFGPYCLCDETQIYCPCLLLGFCPEERLPTAQCPVPSAQLHLQPAITSRHSRAPTTMVEQ
jgi:hypothetical protein